MSNECKHGQLARSCNYCEQERDEVEYETRIAELEAENAELNAKIGRITSRGIEDLRFDNEQMKAENAELKKAGRNLFNALVHVQYAKAVNSPVVPWPDIAPLANALNDLLEAGE